MNGIMCVRVYPKVLRTSTTRVPCAVRHSTTLVWSSCQPLNVRLSCVHSTHMYQYICLSSQLCIAVATVVNRPARVLSWRCGWTCACRQVNVSVRGRCRCHPPAREPPRWFR
eukprot:scpid105574/ scgid17898/ 